MTDWFITLQELRIRQQLRHSCFDWSERMERMPRQAGGMAGRPWWTEVGDPKVAGLSQWGTNRSHRKVAILSIKVSSSFGESWWFGPFFWGEWLEEMEQSGNAVHTGWFGVLRMAKTPVPWSCKCLQPGLKMLTSWSLMKSQKRWTCPKLEGSRFHPRKITSQTSCVVKDGWRSMEKKNRGHQRDSWDSWDSRDRRNRRYPFTAVQVANACGTDATDAA